jgi:hypothetical protein
MVFDSIRAERALRVLFLDDPLNAAQRELSWSHDRVCLHFESAPGFDGSGYSVKDVHCVNWFRVLVVNLFCRECLLAFLAGAAAHRRFKLGFPTRVFDSR